MNVKRIFFACLVTSGLYFARFLVGIRELTRVRRSKDLAFLAVRAATTIINRPNRSRRLDFPEATWSELFSALLYMLERDTLAHSKSLVDPDALSSLLQAALERSLAYSEKFSVEFFQDTSPLMAVVDTLNA